MVTLLKIFFLFQSYHITVSKAIKNTGKTQEISRQMLMAFYPSRPGSTPNRHVRIFTPIGRRQTFIDRCTTPTPLRGRGGRGGDRDCILEGAAWVGLLQDGSMTCWKSRKAAGCVKHGTDFCGDTWGSSVFSSRCLSADMMMMMTLIELLIPITVFHNALNHPMRPGRGPTVSRAYQDTRAIHHHLSNSRRLLRKF